MREFEIDWTKSIRRVRFDKYEFLDNGRFAKIFSDKCFSKIVWTNLFHIPYTATLIYSYATAYVEKKSNRLHDFRQKCAELVIISKIMFVYLPNSPKLSDPGEYCHLL